MDFHFFNKKNQVYTLIQIKNWNRINIILISDGWKK